MRSTNGSDSRQAMSRSSRRKLPLHRLNRNRERSDPEYPKKKPPVSSGNFKRSSPSSGRDKPPGPPCRLLTPAPNTTSRQPCHPASDGEPPAADRAPVSDLPNSPVPSIFVRHLR